MVFEQPVLIELQISRSVVGRIAAEDDQQFHAACVDILNEIAQRLSLIDGIHLERIGVKNSFADIAERSCSSHGQVHGPPPALRCPQSRC